MDYKNDPEYAEFLMYKNYEFKRLDDGSYYLISCKKKDAEEIIIPECVSGIEKGCFSSCAELCRVEFLGSLEMLDDYMFSGCESLDEIVFPKGLEIIGNGAFSGCKSLDEIIIPDGVKCIGDSAFSYCDGLTDIYLPPSLSSVGKDAFLGCTELMYVDVSDIGAWCHVRFANYTACPLCYEASLTLRGDDIEGLEIPESVTRLAPFVFANCSSIELVIFPRYIEYFSPLAFYRCSGIERFEVDSRNRSMRVVDDTFILSGNKLILAADSMEEFPDEIDEIAPGAFAPCTYSPWLEVMREDVRLSRGSLFGLENLEELTIPLRGPEANISFSALFDYRENTWETVLMAEAPQKLAYFCITNAEVLYRNTFDGLKSIQKLVLPDNLVRIEGWPFFGLKLPSLEIPVSVERIDSGIGLNTLKLKVGRGSPYTYKDGYLIDTRTSTLVSASYGKGTIPKGIKRIGCGAFFGDDTLVSVNIGDGVIEVDDYAFAKCSSLTSVRIMDSVKKLSCSAFSECAAIESVLFDNHMLWYGVPYSFRGGNKQMVNVSPSVPLKNMLKLLTSGSSDFAYLERKYKT